MKTVVRLRSPATMGAIFRDLAAGIKPAIEAGLAETGKIAAPTLRKATQDEKIRDLGDYQRGWRWDPLRHFGGRVGKDTQGIRVYNLRRHAIFVEMGRRPGARQPPADALEGWVWRHFNPESPAHARAMAFLLARSIARKGIRARPVLWRRAMQMRLRDIAATQVNAAVDDLFARAATRLRGRGA